MADIERDGSSRARAGGPEGDSEHGREHLERFRARALGRGVNPVLYRAARLVLVPAFLVYFRLRRLSAEHVPRSGPLLLAANHRSFLDPFVIGTLTPPPRLLRGQAGKLFRQALGRRGC